MSVVHLVDPDELDTTAKLWRSIMNTVELSPLSMAEKLGILEYVKHEIMTRMLAEAASKS